MQKDRTVGGMRMLYWLFYAGYVSYSSFLSAFLLERGCTASDLGLLSICTALVNFGAQFPVGALAVRCGSNRRLLQIGLLATAPLGFLLLLGHTKFAWIAAILPVTFCDFSMIGQADGLTLKLSGSGAGVQYAPLRAIGALAGALTSLLLGEVFARTGTAAMPLFHAAFMAAAWASLLAVREPVQPPAARERKKGAFALLRREPNVLWLMLGAMLVFLGWRAILSYLPARIAELGGGTRHQGYYMALSCVSSMPVLFFYPRLRRRFSLGALLLTGTGGMCLRLLLLALPMPLWLVVALQASESICYGLTQPASMELLAKLVPPQAIGLSAAVWTGVQMALCAIVSNAIAMALLRAVPLEGVFACFSALAGAGTVVLALLLRRLPPMLLAAENRPVPVEGC